LRAVLTAQIMARKDKALAEKLHEYKKMLARGVEKKNTELQKAVMA